jgi:hypothetical protein
LISLFFQFSLLSWRVCSIRKYFLYFKIGNLKSKKQKKIFVLRRKKFGRIDSEFDSTMNRKSRMGCFGLFSSASWRCLPRAEITMLLLFRGVATSQESEELRMNQRCIYFIQEWNLLYELVYKSFTTLIKRTNTELINLSITLNRNLELNTGKGESG